MTAIPVYVGIDVAFAKKKKLPVCVCKNDGSVLTSLSLRSSFTKPPKGKGNKASLDTEVRRTFASEVLNWLGELEKAKGLSIKRIAIDAPSNYAINGRRKAEIALDSKGISCFTTPSEKDFEQKISDAKAHLEFGGKEARMPNANQFWMLIGFELFRTLKEKYECIEVYPQAIIRALQCSKGHKSTADGLTEQYHRFALAIGLTPEILMDNLEFSGYGSKHDRLDAYLAAWIASLEENQREGYGIPPDDVIWVPRLP